MTNELIIEKEKNKKTLFVGHYDYSFGTNAYIFEENKFIEIELTFREHDAIYDIGRSMENPHPLKYLKTSYYFEEFEFYKSIKTLERLFDKYENIVLCNNGTYIFISRKILEEYYEKT